MSIETTTKDTEICTFNGAPGSNYSVNMSKKHICRTGPEIGRQNHTEFEIKAVLLDGTVFHEAALTESQAHEWFRHYVDEYISHGHQQFINTKT